MFTSFVAPKKVVVKLRFHALAISWRLKMFCVTLSLTRQVATNYDQLPR